MPPPPPQPPRLSSSGAETTTRRNALIHRSPSRWAATASNCVGARACKRAAAEAVDNTINAQERSSGRRGLNRILPSWTAAARRGVQQNTSGRLTGHFPGVNGRSAADPQLLHSFRKYLRMQVVGLGCVADGVEDHDIGEVALCQSTAFPDAKRGCRERRQLPERPRRA